MAIATFDTLKFANTLKAAGVPDQQAEAQATAFADIIQLNFKELATKEDLQRAKEELDRRIEEVRDELGRRIEEVRDELGRRIEEVRKEFKQELKDLELRLEGKLKELETRMNLRMDSLESGMKMLETRIHGELSLLKWMIGVGLAMGTAILIRLFVYGGTH